MQTSNSHPVRDPNILRHLWWYPYWRLCNFHRQNWIEPSDINVASVVMDMNVVVRIICHQLGNEGRWDDRSMPRKLTHFAAKGRFFSFGSTLLFMRISTTKDQSDRRTDVPRSDNGSQCVQSVSILNLSRMKVWEIGWGDIRVPQVGPNHEC